MTDPKPRRINAIPTEVDTLLRKQYDASSHLHKLPVDHFRAGMIIMANWALDDERKDAFQSLFRMEASMQKHLPAFMEEHEEMTGAKSSEIDLAIVVAATLMVNAAAPVKYAGYEAALRRERGVSWNGQAPA